MTLPPLLLFFTIDLQRTMKSDACSGMSGDIEDLKSSVSNGKAAVASAITDKGVSTSATATFDTMAANIRNIASGIKFGFDSLTLTNYSKSISFSTSFRANNIILTIICNNQCATYDNVVISYCKLSGVEHSTLLRSRYSMFFPKSDYSISSIVTDSSITFQAPSGDMYFRDVDCTYYCIYWE